MPAHAARHAPADRLEPSARTLCRQRDGPSARADRRAGKPNRKRPSCRRGARGITGNNTTARGLSLNRDELIARVAPADLGNACFLKMEAVVVEPTRHHAELYPDLFSPGLGSVDKDGLADYHDLLRRMKQCNRACSMIVIVICSCSRTVFFRRSLSHRNKLNAYFLQSFDATASENGDLCVRLRLGP